MRTTITITQLAAGRLFARNTMAPFHHWWAPSCCMRAAPISAVCLRPPVCSPALPASQQWSPVAARRGASKSAQRKSGGRAQVPVERQTTKGPKERGTRNWPTGAHLAHLAARASSTRAPPTGLQCGSSSPLARLFLFLLLCCCCPLCARRPERAPTNGRPRPL